VILRSYLLHVLGLLLSSLHQGMMLIIGTYQRIVHFLVYMKHNVLFPSYLLHALALPLSSLYQGVVLITATYTPFFYPTPYLLASSYIFELDLY
ncbi:hypothetical protein, partial [Lactobacillus gasseri]|uniref:hypothetical protein n=1 Tax=Lactobacillus gasseri TaxID=1596 RepID=UPI001C5BA808